LGPVSVELRIDNALKPGRFGISSHMRAAEGGRRPGTVVMLSGERIELGDAKTLIGRLADCDIVITDGNTSRHHAVIQRAGTGFTVSDLGSTNGTFVNGERLAGDHRLADGDTITVGAVALRFEAS